MPLQYHVWYSLRASATRDTPPGLDELKIVPTSHTLIHGDRDAVLVDTPLTLAATQELIEWIKGFSVTLKYIFVTHPHGDHYFGLGPLLDAFPSAKAIATKACAATMVQEIEVENGSNPRFRALFPSETPTTLVPAEGLETDTFVLEDEVFQVIPTGHTDTDDTSTLFVPSLRLAVTGDAVYNNVHPYLKETETIRKLAEWIDALDKISSLDPLYVVGGHKDPKQSDNTRCIGDTKTYFEDLIRLSHATTGREQLYHAMLEIHGARLNPGSLWGATGVVKDPKWESSSKE